MDDDRQIMA